MLTTRHTHHYRTLFRDIAGKEIGIRGMAGISWYVSDSLEGVGGSRTCTLTSISNRTQHKIAAARLMQWIDEGLVERVQAIPSPAFPTLCMVLKRGGVAI